MERMLQPEIGLLLWTIITFLLLVAILAKIGWKPVLKALNNREGKIKGDLERAEAANKEAERLRSELESKLGEAHKTMQDMLSQAKAEGDKAKSQILVTARDEAQKIVEKGRTDLAQETEKLKGDLRKEVAGLAVMVAEKALSHAVDNRVHEKILEDSLKEISGAEK